MNETSKLSRRLERSGREDNDSSTELSENETMELMHTFDMIGTIESIRQLYISAQEKGIDIAAMESMTDQSVPVTLSESLGMSEEALEDAHLLNHNLLRNPSVEIPASLQKFETHLKAIATSMSKFQEQGDRTQAELQNKKMKDVDRSLKVLLNQRELIEKAKKVDSDFLDADKGRKERYSKNEQLSIKDTEQLYDDAEGDLAIAFAYRNGLPPKKIRTELQRFQHMMEEGEDSFIKDDVALLKAYQSFEEVFRGSGVKDVVSDIKGTDDISVIDLVTQETVYTVAMQHIDSLKSVKEPDKRQALTLERGAQKFATEFHKFVGAIDRYFATKESK